MERAGRILGGWAAAALVATLLASIAHSLFVQAALADLGVALPLGVRTTTMVRDLLGLAPTLGLVLAGSLGAGFAVAWLVSRARPGLAALAWPLAGWAAVAAALLAMRLWFGFSPLAGARTTAGFVAISLSGLAGGLVFAWVLARFRRPAAR